MASNITKGINVSCLDDNEHSLYVNGMVSDLTMLILVDT